MESLKIFGSLLKEVSKFVTIKNIFYKNLELSTNIIFWGTGSTKGFAAFWKNQIVKFPENMQIIMKLRVIHAAEELHDVDIEKRQCKFEDEGSELKIFRYLPTIPMLGGILKPCGPIFGRF